MKQESVQRSIVRGRTKKSGNLDTIQRVFLNSVAYTLSSMATPSTSEPASPDTSTDRSLAQTDKPVTPLRCFTGAAIASGIATILYFLTQSIIQTFASKPLPTSNVTAVNISIAVRTLVMGLSTLATAIFAIAAVGLVALGIQLFIQQARKPSA
jgi:hypothetical protein